VDLIGPLTLFVESSSLIANMNTRFATRCLLADVLGVRYSCSQARDSFYRCWTSRVGILPVGNDVTGSIWGFCCAGERFGTPQSFGESLLIFLTLPILGPLRFLAGQEQPVFCKSRALVLKPSLHFMLLFRGDSCLCYLCSRMPTDQVLLLSMRRSV
jgi:hypothetical protein